MQAQQQRAPSGLLQDRRFWLLMAGGVAACGWAYSLLGGYSVTERVFLDIDVDGARAGRVVVGVHGSAVPRAGVNFTELASHVRGYGYRGCAFYDVVPRFAVVGGDVTKNDGTGGAAALGPSFAKEKSPLKHARGTVSMIADDDSAVRSQFFICCAMAPSLDGQMVPFGTVLEGMDVVDRLSCLPADEATRRPLSPAVIADCGVLEGGGRGASVEGLLDSALGWLLASGGGGGRT